MSLTVEIGYYDASSNVSTALRDKLNKLAVGIASLGGGSSTNEIIKSAICRGILQNEVDITFANSWGGNLYKGIMDGVSELSKTKIEAATFGASLNAFNSLFKFGTTALNMGGVSMAGAGAGTTKIYEGSSISSLNVVMKWYTPVDDSYKEAMYALMLLGFPSFRKAINENNSSDLVKDVLGEGKLANVANFIASPFTAVIDTLGTLLSFNPVPVVLKIMSNDGSDNYKTTFKLHPLVISSINFNFSRETHNGLPIVITANVAFEFYQVLGNNGYGGDSGDFILAGVPLMGNLDEISSNKGIPKPRGDQ